VIGASIMLIRKIVDKNKAAHEGIWNKEAKGSFELRGKTMGLIGYGNIGTQTSIMAEAMGMKVKFYDTDAKLPLGNAQAVKSLKDLVSSSDIISIHVPETNQTKNLISADVIKQFKQGAILINYARGEVVDLDALSKAIKSKAVSGAAIDVYPWEPEKNGDKFETPLQGLSNVILTPHIGGSTEEAQENIGEDVSIKLYQYLERGVSNGSHSIPSIGLPPVDGAHRILHIHNNVPGVLSAINTVMSKNKINIVGQYLKTNDEIGYVVLDVDSKLSKTAFELLKEVKHTIRARMLY
jgi:D-3-phosphoglycerate dehydrogenase